MCVLWAQVSMAQTSRYAEHSVLAEGKWVKIRVKEAGVYQLTSSQLRSMGFSNPDRVRLYGLNLEVLPETMIENIDDDLVELPLWRADGKVLFYGRGQTQWTLSSASSATAEFTHFNNPYSLYTYYFLTEDSSVEPAEFAQYAYEVGSDAAELDYFPDHALVETDAYSFLNAGRTFFESYDFSSGSSRTYTLSMPGLKGGTTAKMAMQFCAASSTSTSSLTVEVNGETLGTMSFSKIGGYDYGKLSAKTYSLSSPAESNSVKLTHNRTSGVSGHLDYLRGSYVRNLAMSGNQLLFRPAQSGDVKFKLTGATSETVVWHINKAKGWEQVAATLSGTTLEVPFTSESTSSTTWKDEELVAVNPSATFPSPTTIGTIENQDLHALRDIDLVIVVPASGKLTAQAQRLADAHAEVDGMTCQVVSADKIYNEFSSGTPDATALRRFMKMLWDTASSEETRPRNLLLFGGCVWDNRLVTSALSGTNADDLLLCYESDNSLSHTNSYVLEEYFALVDDNTTGNVLTMKPRLGVGRIPTTSASEAKGVVDKLLTYINNEQVGAWKNTICVLCDDGNDNIHMKDGEAVISSTSKLYPDYYYKRIYWDTYERQSTSTGNRYPGVESDIDKQMRDGALIMNYTGHGAPTQMSHEKVLLLSDFQEWSSPRLPLWITAACDIAPFDMNEDGIGQSALLNPNGTAMGFIGTARTVYSGPNRTMNVQLMKHLFGSDSYDRQYTIGEALALAKCDLISQNSSSINKAHFVLLGDPAIRLQIPTYKVVIDQINGTDADASEAETVSAGSKVTVTGHIEDEDGNTATNYNGSVTPTIFDNLEQITCLNNPYGESNGNTDETPYTFTDRPRVLYYGTDTVQSGQFTFTFPVPLDNNYSGETGLISLYAANAEKTIESNGQFTNFIINGTSQTQANDTVGPTITLWLNTEDFQSGDVVNETPLLYATIFDEDGINMTGSGVGHDITLVIDNQESLTYSLNSYFTPTTGDYRSGTVTFVIPALSEGYHTLTLRAYDVLNNPSTVTVEFYVNVGQKPTIYDMTIQSPSQHEKVFTILTNRPGCTLDIALDVYDVAGRHLWRTTDTATSDTGTISYTWNMDGTGAHLPSGVYIVKCGISSSGGPSANINKKFLVAGREKQ